MALYNSSSSAAEKAFEGLNYLGNLGKTFKEQVSCYHERKNFGPGFKLTVCKMRFAIRFDNFVEHFLIFMKFA